MIRICEEAVRAPDINACTATGTEPPTLVRGTYGQIQYYTVPTRTGQTTVYSLPDEVGV